MSEQEFLDADYEVISMCNKCHKDGPGHGGELPTIGILSAGADPEEVNMEPSPEAVAALDDRIQNVRNAMPLILFGAAFLFAFIAATAM